MKRSPLGNDQVTAYRNLTFSFTGHKKFSLPGTQFVTIFEWFLLRSDLLKQVRTMKKASCDLVKDDRDRLMEVTV